jgi:hypothetical protein
VCWPGRARLGWAGPGCVRPAWLNQGLVGHGLLTSSAEHIQAPTQGKPRSSASGAKAIGGHSSSSTKSLRMVTSISALPLSCVQGVEPNWSQGQL